MSGAIRQVTMRGRVQGVGYRYWVEQQARARGLEGWGRNRRDGRVEALFAGPPDVGSCMIALCRRGPTAARGDAVEEEKADAEPARFVRPAARFSGLSTMWC